MLSRFHLIPERNRRTDRRTHRFAISISRVSMLTRDKKSVCLVRVKQLIQILRWHLDSKIILILPLIFISRMNIHHRRLLATPGSSGKPLDTAVHAATDTKPPFLHTACTSKQRKIHTNVKIYDMTRQRQATSSLLSSSAILSVSKRPVYYDTLRVSFLFRTTNFAV